MSQMQMPSGIMWGQRPQQPQYNPAPTGQNPQMLGMPQPGQPGMQGLGQYPGLMQNAGQQSMGQSQGMNAGNASGAGNAPSGYTPPPGFQPQGQIPGPGWMGNNIGSMPMGNQPGMSPGSQTPNYGPMDTSGFSQAGANGSPFGANGQMSRTPTTNLSGTPQMGNVLPGGGVMPQRKPGIVNQFSGGGPSGALNVNGQNRPPRGFMGASGGQQSPASQFPGLAQNTAQSGPDQTITPTPISASPQSDPSSYPQNGAAQFGGASGYAGGGNSGGIGVGVGGPSSDPATLAAQQAANAEAFRRASMTQGNNNTRNMFNPAAAGVGQPMQTGLAGIPTPGATYGPNGGATLSPQGWSPRPYNPWAGGPRPAQQMQ